jgi:hypothetical protein
MDSLHLIQAMATPAIFFSGGSLLLLSLNARLIAIFSRVRQLHDQEPSAAVRTLLVALGRRARMIRNAFAATLVGVLCALIGSLALALGELWQPFSQAGVIILAVCLVALAVGVLFYLSEIVLAVPSLDLSEQR